MKRTIYLIAVILLASSCGPTTNVFRTAKSGNLSYTTVDPIITSDLHVYETKVTGDASNYSDAYIAQADMERMAIANALKKMDADILLEPQFEYQRVNGNGKIISVKVSGYAAKYVNFRKVTEEDIDIYNNYYNMGKKKK